MLQKTPALESKPKKQEIARLSHYAPKKFPKYKEVAAFDIETNGLYGQFILGAIVLGDTGEFHTFMCPDDMVKFMMKHHSYDYYAHNGSGYDFNYLLEPLRNIALSDDRVMVKPIKQGDTRIIGFSIEWSKHTVALKDSLPLLNTSLAKSAKAFAPHMPKLSIGLDAGVIFNPMNAEHMEYLKRDCETLIAVMRAVRVQAWEKFQCKIGLTAGSTAMNAFKAAIPIGRSYYRLTGKAELFLRGAYYGGYVYPGTKVAQYSKYTTLDYTGAYAGVMKEDYPIGRAVHTLEFAENRTGFYRVWCTAPKTRIPCVPCRTEKGVIYYQDCTFETIIDNETLKFAENRGYSFTILEGYYFVEEEDVFTSIIARCEELELSGNGDFKPLTKLIRNALYGKFGTRENMTEMVISTEAQDHFEFYTDPDTGMDIDGVQMKTTKVDAPYIQLQWAALVTARQRMKLIEKLELVLEAGSETVYGDTDSIIGDTVVMEKLMEEGKITLGTSYGELKREHDFTSIIFLGPKCYGGSVIGEEKPYVLRAKGVPNQKLVYSLFTSALSGKRNKQYFDASNSVYRRLLNPTLPIKVCDGRNRKLTDIINSEAWEFDTETGEILAKRRKA